MNDFEKIISRALSGDRKITQNKEISILRPDPRRLLNEWTRSILIWGHSNLLSGFGRKIIKFGYFRTSLDDSYLLLFIWIIQNLKSHFSQFSNSSLKIFNFCPWNWIITVPSYWPIPQSFFALQVQGQNLIP